MRSNKTLRNLLHHFGRLILLLGAIAVPLQMTSAVAAQLCAVHAPDDGVPSHATHGTDSGSHHASGDPDCPPCSATCALASVANGSGGEAVARCASAAPAHGPLLGSGIHGRSRRRPPRLS